MCNGYKVLLSRRWVGFPLNRVLYRAFYRLYLLVVSNGI